MAARFPTTRWSRVVRALDPAIPALGLRSKSSVATTGSPSTLSPAAGTCRPPRPRTSCKASREALGRWRAGLHEESGVIISAGILKQENEMATVTVEVPDSAFSALRRSPEEFAQEMRIAAAIQWYHQELISQGKAAEIAGLSRADFLDALFRRRCLHARSPSKS